MTKHEELLELLNPLIDFMDKNEFTYLVTAGKNCTCSRYMRGNNDDMVSMLTGMAKNNPCVKEVIKEIYEDLIDN